MFQLIWFHKYTKLTPMKSVNMFHDILRSIFFVQNNVLSRTRMDNIFKSHTNEAKFFFF